MKKILAIIMALTLVFTMTMGIVALADEPVEATETVEEAAEETTEPALPEDYDESSIYQYLVFDMQDKENITIKSYITGTDGTLDYYAQMYESYGQAVTDTEYNGQRALMVGESTLTTDDLADSAGIAYIPNDGFLADKDTYVYCCGTLLSGGYTEGDKVATVVLDFGRTSKTHDIVAGQQNSFIAVSYVFHWINILIVAMCLVVLILIVVIAVLTIKKKKSAKVAEENSEYVSEDNLFDVLVSEASDDNADETTEEVAEEEVTEAVEDTTEESTEE